MAAFYLYGLYTTHGKCRYAGITGRIKARHTPGSSFVKTHSLIVRVLRTFDTVNQARRVESQVILAYKRRNECDLNKRKVFVDGDNIRLSRHHIARLEKIGISQPLLIVLDLVLRLGWNEAQKLLSQSNTKDLKMPGFSPKIFHLESTETFYRKSLRCLQKILDSQSQ